MKKLLKYLLLLVLCFLLIVLGAYLSIIGFDMNHDGTNVNDDTARMLQAFGELLVLVSVIGVAGLAVNTISYLRRKVSRALHAPEQTEPGK